MDWLFVLGWYVSGGIGYVILWFLKRHSVRQRDYCPTVGNVIFCLVYAGLGPLVVAASLVVFILMLVEGEIHPPGWWSKKLCR